MQAAALLTLFSMFLLCVADATNQVDVSPYNAPPSSAVQDRYYALIEFAVLGSNGTALVSPTLFAEPAATTHGAPSESQLFSRMLVASLTFDIGQIASVATNGVMITVINSSTVYVNINTVMSRQLHNAIIGAMQANVLVNRTQSVFAIQQGTSGILSAQRLWQVYRYRAQLEMDIIDGGGGRGPLWTAREILFPSVISALRSDLENILAIQTAFAAVAPGARYYPEANPMLSDLPATVTILTALPIADGGGARRVAANVVLEVTRQQDLNQQLVYLLGRHTLPLTTGELQRVVHVNAGAECVVTPPNSRPPPPSFCGRGCSIPAILWCCLVAAVILIVWVAFGGSTPEEAQEDRKVIEEQGVRELEEEHKEERGYDYHGVHRPVMNPPPTQRYIAVTTPTDRMSAMQAPRNQSGFKSLPGEHQQHPQRHVDESTVSPNPNGSYPPSLQPTPTASHVRQRSNLTPQSQLSGSATRRRLTSPTPVHQSVDADAL